MRTVTPWFTANLTLDRWPRELESGEPAWDNVIYNSKSLGYVVANHQSVRQHEDRSVWTYYWAMAEDTPRDSRKRLLANDWQYFKELILADLARVHPDIRECVSRIDIMRIRTHSAYNRRMGIRLQWMCSSDGEAATRDEQIQAQEDQVKRLLADVEELRKQSPGRPSFSVDPNKQTVAELEAIRNRLLRRGRTVSTIVGPQRAVRGLWDLLEESWGPPRECRWDQPHLEKIGSS